MKHLIKLLSAAVILTGISMQLGNEAHAVSQDFKLGVRFWDGCTFSADLQKKVLKVASTESDMLYGVEGGSVSRNLAKGDGGMLEEWQTARATTVKSTVTGTVWYPGAEDGVKFTAKLGEHPKHPKLVYLEITIPTVVIQDHPDPQFKVHIDEDKYPVIYPTLAMRHILDTRTQGANNINELKESVKKQRNKKDPAFWLNVVLKGEGCG